MWILSFNPRVTLEFENMSSGFVLFGKYSQLCFDDQRSEHSFVADRSDINLIDDANNATSVNAIDLCYC